jgi:hypothetical protein
MGLHGMPPRGWGYSNLSWSSKNLHQSPHHQDSLLANKIRWRICSRASRKRQHRQLQAQHGQNYKAGCTGMPHLSIHVGQSAPERRVGESEHASIRLVQLQYEEYCAGKVPPSDRAAGRMEFHPTIIWRARRRASAGSFIPGAATISAFQWSVKRPRKTSCVVGKRWGRLSGSWILPALQGSRPARFYDMHPPFIRPSCHWRAFRERQIRVTPGRAFGYGRGAVTAEAPSRA